MASHNRIRRFILQASAVLVTLGSTCSCLQFNYPSFDAANRDDFSFSPGSGIANGALQITPNTGNISHRSGRVLYNKATLKLWNNERTAITSFSTEFVLNILPKNGTGEGMAFILTNNPALPSDSSGQWLGMVNNQTDGAAANCIVAMEFDTRKSNRDDPDGNHVGVDINSIKTLAPYPLSNLSIVLASGLDTLVRIQYDGAVLAIVAMQEQKYFAYAWPVDLSRYLVEDIAVGFSASTGDFTELHQIKAWNFSTGDVADNNIHGKRGRMNLILAILILLAVTGSILAFLVWRRLTRKRRLAYHNLEKMIDAHGPVKFKLRELRNATANFSPNRKLGRGGFGTVYLGYLKRMNMEVAVKRVSTSSNSRRGEQEFVAEVNTISKLSHRNLVKLIGWCHEKDELLLVYEYFPMGSLDKLLYADARASASPPELTWERRYRIVCGVASALDYLHHGSSKRVLHRDVKPSNVVLDADYNAKLGDFGLARVVQRDGATHYSTRAVAGTRAYMAYESFFTGRASLDTDVFAFGVFAMEVLSGRKPSSSVSYRDGGDDDDDESTSFRRGHPMYIVDWAWRLYGEGRALHVADAALNGDFDHEQMECAVRLALACCHPNPRARPSMRTAVQVLIGGAKAPEPPFQKPAFVWPPLGEHKEIELPHVGLLFTGGHTSFCSMTSSSITGR
ncbi:hypothetical protein EJB05_08882, partial [Eragrostis curvula]